MKNKDNFINDFMTAQENYLQHKDTESWNKMFINCQKMCEVTLANYARSQKLRLDNEMFIDYAMEASIRIMNRYKKPKGYRVDYLRTVCRFSLIDVMYNKKVQFEDSIVCYGLERGEDDNDAIFNEEV